MKKQLLVFSALVLCGGVLASCNQTTTTSEVDTRLSVALNAEKGSTITLDNVEGKYDAGETVKFTVKMDSDLNELVAVMLGEEELKFDSNLEGSFTMPNHDVTLKTVVYSKGDGSLRNVSKLADDFVEPETKDDVEAILVAGEAVVGKFNSEEKLHNTFANFSWTYADLVSKPSRDGNVIVRGTTKKNTTVTQSAVGYALQRGLYDESHYYEIEESNDNTFSVTTAQVVPHIYKVVDADETSNSNEITKADATSKAASSGFLEAIQSKILGNASIWYGKEDGVTVSTEVSSDKTTFTTTLSSIYPAAYSSGTNKVSEFKVTADGDNFISKIEFNYKEYAYADYDAESKEFADGATPTLTSGLTYEATRDYKNQVEMPFDIADFVMNDFDITLLQTIYKSAYSSTTTEITDSIEGNSTLQFRAINKDYDSFASIKPLISGVTEGFGTINKDCTSMTVDKIGEFEVTFDNGLGKTKKVKLTATQPTATGIEFSGASSAMFVGVDNVLNVTVTPTLAKQDATLEIDTSKSGVNATITKVSDGVFKVNPEAAGTLYLKSTANEGKIEKTLTVKTFVKPSISEMTEVLAANSFRVYTNSQYYYVNFNADGTGKVYAVGSSYSTSSNYENTFTWTVDEDTLAFTIVNGTHEGEEKWVELSSFTYISESNTTASFKDCYYDKVTEIASKSLTKVDRKTFD